MAVIKKYWIGFFLALLVFTAGVMIYNKLHAKKLPANLVMGSGRIDGDLINLSSKYPGRIGKIYYNDGDAIAKNDIVAVLESREYEAKADAVSAQVEAAEKELAARETERDIALKTIPLAVDKADAGVKGANAQKEALIKSIDALQSVVRQDRKDLKRLNALWSQKLIDKHQVELAKLRYRTDSDKLHGLQEQLKQLEAAVSIARTGKSEAEAIQAKREVLHEGIAALKAKIKALKASENEVAVILDELKLRSPVNGYVVEKIANAGEVVAAGMPVVTLIDPDSLYLKLFVDTIENGKIKIGDKAEIFLDAYPDKPIPAKVVLIAQKAEFTPKEVSVRDDRIQRVYAVHLKPLQPQPLLKLGIPAIGVISTDGKGLPASLHELPPL